MSASLKSICKEWQKRLRLQDWEIEVNHCRKMDLDNEKADGQTSYWYEHKKAKIKIVYENETDIRPYNGNTYEYIILHELLEILIAPLADFYRMRDKEQSINMIVDALLALKYKDKR